VWQHESASPVLDLDGREVIGDHVGEFGITDAAHRHSYSRSRTVTAFDTRAGRPVERHTDSHLVTPDVAVLRQKPGYCVSPSRPSRMIEKRDDRKSTRLNS